MKIKIITSILLFVCLVPLLSIASDRNNNLKKFSRYTNQNQVIQPIDIKYHYIGRLWNRVTNFGKIGDDAYLNRTPSCDWPNMPAQYPTNEGDFPNTGRSGNSYLYRASLWLAAKVAGVPHVTMPEYNSEFSPLESIHVNYPGERAMLETWTKYYDVSAPSAPDHFPLGLEVTERTFSWPESYRYDFIIHQFSIKNVGIDTDNDNIPDTPRDLEDFYVILRMDGDVSKQPDWPTEGPYLNEDDLAGVNSSWSFIEKFPGWSDVNHGLTEENADTTMMFMFDADNPNVPSEYQDPGTGTFAENDLGNPDPTGRLQSPGFLGFKILKTEPASFKVSKFRCGEMYSDPMNDLGAFEKLIAPIDGEDPFEQQGPSGIVVDPDSGTVTPDDYRGYLTLGPLKYFQAGDSVIVTAALGVGADADSGGIYSLMKLVQIMNTAQMIVDSTFVVDVRSDTELPVLSGYQLYQNYPNPFNPQTRFSFYIPDKNHVLIEVFNVLGQKIAVILDEEMPAGLHEVHFNALDSPAGVYFYRLQSGHYIAAKKMLLIK